MTPSELLNLMESSIIKTGSLGNTKVYGRPELLALTPETFFKGVDRNDKSIPIYNLKQTSNRMAGFESYICDYDANDIRYQVLHDEADFCFTITMNGCTFGLGSANEDGSIMVSHGNKVSVKDDLGKSLGDQYGQVAGSLHGQDAMYITPEMYRTGEKANLTTFGVRIHGKWNFFYQSYKLVSGGGGKMQLLGLFPFKTNMLMG